MKNKKLLKKYFYVMSFSIFLIPVTFMALNYIFLLSYTAIAYLFNLDWKFTSSFVYVNFYIFYFLLLIILVWIGSKYFSKVINRISDIHKTVEKITYDEGYPEKLNFYENSEDEINGLSGAINKLIDRLRYKESLLAQQNNLKNEHIKQLSHDINTPLTAIMLELYELENDFHIPEEKMEPLYSKIMYTNQLVKKVGEMETLDFTNQYLFLEPCRIDIVVRAALNKWNYLIEKNKISVNLEIENNISLKSDVLFFERLLDNIFSNIIKHSHTADLEVVLRKRELIIKDFGIGYDVDMETTNGKGLYIIKDICDKLKLKLVINSSRHGTEYRICIRDNNEATNLWLD